MYFRNLNWRLNVLNEALNDRFAPASTHSWPKVVTSTHHSTVCLGNARYPFRIYRIMWHVGHVTHSCWHCSLCCLLLLKAFETGWSISVFCWAVHSSFHVWKCGLLDLVKFFGLTGIFPALESVFNSSLKKMDEEKHGHWLFFLSLWSQLCSFSSSGSFLHACCYLFCKDLIGSPF